tara:strand:- start:1500 stop:1646 length:147 start_codon:yes stop_codon:yes gene_type:complete
MSQLKRRKFPEKSFELHYFSAFYSLDLFVNLRNQNIYFLRISHFGRVE